MNTTTNSVSTFDQPPTEVSAFRAFHWCVLRELWEFRSIYIAPLAVAVVFFVGYMISLIHLPAKLRALEATAQHQLILKPFDLVALAIMAATFLVSIFYCLEALHGERRDRSILFWKSLPVSDLTVVLSKASIPLVILPLLTFVLTVATQCMMALLGNAVLMGSGLGPMVWRHMPLFLMWTMLLYHLVAIHILWFAPFYGWMLMVSAWARRAPLLWATVPLVALAAVASALGAGSLLSALFGYGGPEDVPFTTGDMTMEHSMHMLPPWKFMLTPGLWIGLAMAAGFLFAAARIRRHRGPI